MRLNKHRSLSQFCLFLDLDNFSMEPEITSTIEMGGKQVAECKSQWFEAPKKWVMIKMLNAWRRQSNWRQFKVHFTYIFNIGAHVIFPLTHHIFSATTNKKYFPSFSHGSLLQQKIMAEGSCQRILLLLPWQDVLTLNTFLQFRQLFVLGYLCDYERAIDTYRAI